MSLFKKTIINTQNNIVDLEPMMILQGKIMAELNKTKVSKKLRDYEFKVFSQNGEDGIIQHLIHKIPIKNKIFVEFGVEGYNEANTRFLLLNDNWSGLIIDGSETYMNNVKNSTLGWKYDLKAVSAFIDKENINTIITNAGISGEIGLLSVDIDGNDYWVLQAIDCISPQILIVEYNSLFGRTAKVTTPYNKDFVRSKYHYSNTCYGASISALTDLANKKGYSLVDSNTMGNNLFFVKQEYLSIENQKSPQEAWVNAKFKESRDENGDLTYFAAQDTLNLLSEVELFNIDTQKTEKIKDIQI